MKKSITRVLSLALAVVMLLGVMPFAMAADGSDTSKLDVTVSVTATPSVVESGETFTVSATLSGKDADKCVADYQVPAGNFQPNTGYQPGTAMFTAPEVETEQTYTFKVNATAENIIHATGSATVTVKPKTTTPAYTLEVSADRTMKMGETVTLTPNLTPALDTAVVTYASSKDDVAMINSSNALVAVGYGEATITATAKNGEEVLATDSFKVTVSPSVLTATVGKNELKLEETVQIAASLKPEISGTEITYTPSNDNITVSATGLITAKKVGDAKVTVAVKDHTEITPVEISLVVTDGKVHAKMEDVVMIGPEEGKKVEVIFTPASAKDKIKISYSSNIPSLIAVDETTGALTSKGPGEVTIVAALSKKDANDTSFELAEKTVSCKVTAKAGASISADSKSTTKDSHDIKPILKGNDGKAIEGAKYKFTVDGKVVAESAESYTLKKEKQGVVEVKINLVSATNIDPKSVNQKTIYVAFAETLNASARIAKDTFLFSDTGAFSSVEINNRTQSDPKNFTMRMLWNISGVDYSYVQLRQDASTTSYGVISYPGSHSNKFENWKPYSTDNVKGLKFTALESGKVVLEYQLTEKELVVQSGTITILTGNVGSDFTYYTTYNKPISFKKDDFEKLWNKQSFKSKLSYVMFDAEPEYGELFRTSKQDKKVVFAFDEFYLKPGTNQMALADVTYKPNSSKVNPYQVLVPFTLYGDNKTDKFNGVLAVAINEAMPFTDVKTNDWFYEYVKYVYTNSIMTGTSATEFAPNAPLTRGMVVTMLYRMEEEPAVVRPGSFTDVPEGQWYSKAVEWAAYNDIVKGYGDTFGPNNNITRQDLAVILYRFAKYKKMDTTSFGSLTGYVDYQQVSDYAADALKWASFKTIIGGDDAGRILPTGNATRAQAAKMFTVFIEGPIGQG